MIKDSGERREFDSGAVRDVQEGKGRCDLLPLDTASFVLDDDILYYINSFVRTGDDYELKNAIHSFTKKTGWDIFTMLLEVAMHYEEGARKYAERNWEKGIPLHCYIDSGVRHYLKWRRGDTDERHDRAFVWNMLGAIWTKEHHPDLIDLPFGERVEN